MWDVTWFAAIKNRAVCEFLLTHPVWDVTFSSSTSILASFKFLLTHPVWDVTVFTIIFFMFSLNFYSHIPCGMWPSTASEILSKAQISTHTSRVGCDKKDRYSSEINRISTHTSRVGCDSIQCYQNTILQIISTHTSRVGCDKKRMEKAVLYCNFYSHIPCGMWH